MEGELVLLFAWEDAVDEDGGTVVELARDLDRGFDCLLSDAELARSRTELLLLLDDDEVVLLDVVVGPATVLDTSLRSPRSPPVRPPSSVKSIGPQSARPKPHNNAS